MTGLPEFNYPAFHAAANRLRSLGYDVVSPAELCSEMGKPWDWYMRHCLKAIADCDAIYPLSGWENSRGARLEMHIAAELGLTVMAATA